MDFGDIILARLATRVTGESLASYWRVTGELLAAVLIAFGGGVVSLSAIVTSRNGNVRSPDFEVN